MHGKRLPLEKRLSHTHGSSTESGNSYVPSLVVSCDKDCYAIRLTKLRWKIWIPPLKKRNSTNPRPTWHESFRIAAANVRWFSARLYYIIVDFSRPPTLSLTSGPPTVAQTSANSILIVSLNLGGADRRPSHRPNLVSVVKVCAREIPNFTPVAGCRTPRHPPLPTPTNTIHTQPADVRLIAGECRWVCVRAYVTVITINDVVHQDAAAASAEWRVRTRRRTEQRNYETIVTTIIIDTVCK